MSDDEKIKIESGMVIFDSLETLISFGKSVRETVWESKEKAMREFLAANPDHMGKLKELWFEIWAREWGAWGLMIAEHGRLFAREAEKIVGEHDWLVPGNYFSGADLARVVAELLGEDEWIEPDIKEPNLTKEGDR